MKKIAVLAALAMLLGCFALPVFAAEQKIAVVDLERCLTGSKNGAKLGKEFRAKREELGKKLEAKEADLKKMIAEYEKQAPLMSADAKNAKKAEFEKKRDEYQKELSAAEQKMRASGDELTGIVVKDLQGIMDDLAKKNGYSLIINRSGAWVLYFDKALDITDEVIRIYDEKAK